MLTYKVRKTTDEEFKDKMPYLTSSMVEAINTCPRFGIIHNVMGKRFVTGYRQMALEAGSLMHDIFAVLNLLHVGENQGFQDHMHHHGKLLLPDGRWEQVFSYATREGLKKKPNPERAAIATIASSDFYDDPNDKNRTISNLEICAIQLIAYHEARLTDLPIYIADPKDPTAPIGVEISLDGVFEIDDGFADYTIRCIGLADVVYANPDDKTIVKLGEYKTTANMNDAWREAFNTRHQLTLYNALLNAYFPERAQDDMETIMIGSAIPVRMTSTPVRHFTVERDQENIQDMLNTFKFTNGIKRQFEHKPLSAPMFTHSCSRYFRPCSLMDLCIAASDDQYDMLSSMEVEKTLSPSEQKAFMRNM